MLNITIAISLTCFHGHHSLTVKLVKVTTSGLAILLTELFVAKMRTLHSDGTFACKQKNGSIYLALSFVDREEQLETEVLLG